jgi:hypothetical protein
MRRKKKGMIVKRRGRFLPDALGWVKTATPLHHVLS